MNRTEYSRVLGKILSYVACGKVAIAKEWAATLVQMLQNDRLID